MRKLSHMIVSYKSRLHYIYVLETRFSLSAFRGTKSTVPVEEVRGTRKHETLGCNYKFPSGITQDENHMQSKNTVG